MKSVKIGQFIEMLKFRKELKIGLREKLIILGPAVVLAIFAFVVVYYFVDPFPPWRITIGCGPAEGANFGYAQAYREILSRESIRLGNSKIRKKL